jgi:hypothetical protein
MLIVSAVMVMVSALWADPAFCDIVAEVEEATAMMVVPAGIPLLLSLICVPTSAELNAPDVSVTVGEPLVTLPVPVCVGGVAFHFKRARLAAAVAVGVWMNPTCDPSPESTAEVLMVLVVLML